MCLNDPRPLKTTSIQNNPILKSYKTRTCHHQVVTQRRKCSYLIVGHAIHHLLSLKLRFVQEGAHQGIEEMKYNKE